MGAHRYRLHVTIDNAACEAHQSAWAVGWPRGDGECPSHVLHVHGLLGPSVGVQGEGVVVWAVDVRQHEGLLVLGLGVDRGDVVFVCVVHHLVRQRQNAGKRQEEMDEKQKDV